MEAESESNLVIYGCINLTKAIVYLSNNTRIMGDFCAQKKLQKNRSTVIIATVWRSWRSSYTRLKSVRLTVAINWVLSCD
ncbi:hypothetical protein SPLC1_S540030 [Arthrospira platensis C1]|nr:hypothetical protein SPLC1_S540030 [Arthrospira platensis C1]